MDLNINPWSEHEQMEKRHGIVQKSIHLQAMVMNIEASFNFNIFFYKSCLLQMFQLLASVVKYQQKVYRFDCACGFFAS